MLPRSTVLGRVRSLLANLDLGYAVPFVFFVGFVIIEAGETVETGFGVSSFFRYCFDLSCYRLGYHIRFLNRSMVGCGSETLWSLGRLPARLQLH